MKIRMVLLSFLFALFCSSKLDAQNLNNALRQGNNSYKERYYGDAVQHYKDALKVDSTSSKAKFALADALYQKKQDSLAMTYYQEVLQDSLSRWEQAEVLHNMGNIMMRAKDYKNAFESYKQSLILNPSDDDTRYNLVLAQKLMPKDNKQNQQNQNQDNQNQQQDKNKDKQKKDEDKKKEEPKKQEPPKDNQQKPKQDKPQEQDKSQKKEEKDLNKQQLEQLLDSYKASDEKTRQKMQKVQVYLKNKNKQKAKKKW